MVALDEFEGAGGNIVLMGDILYLVLKLYRHRRGGITCVPFRPVVSFMFHHPPAHIYICRLNMSMVIVC